MSVAAWPIERALTFLLGLAFCVGCALYLYLSRERLLGPIGLFLMVLAVWFGSRGVFVALEPEYLIHSVVRRGSDRWSALMYALLLTGFWAGLTISTYHSRLGDWIENRFQTFSFLRLEWSDSAFRRVLLLYVLGAAGKLYRILTGTFVGAQQARPEAPGLMVQAAYDPVAIVMSTVLPVVATAAFVLMAVLAVRDRRWTVLGIVLALELAYAYMTAARGAFLGVGMVTVLAFHFWGRLSARSIVLVGTLGVVAVFAVVGPYRAVVMTLDLGSTERVELSLLLSRLAQGLEAGYREVARDPVKYAEQYALSRFAGLDSFAGAIQSIRSGQAGFAGGETFVGGAVSSVPRLFWPDRPTLNLGAWFPVQYLNYPKSTETAIPMSRIAEFYVNFGVTGVISGGVIMGMILRCIRSLLRVRTITGLALFIFLAVQFVVLGEKSFSRVFVLWKPLAIFFVCLWMMTWKFRTHEDISGDQPPISR